MKKFFVSVGWRRRELPACRLPAPWPGCMQRPKAVERVRDAARILRRQLQHLDNQKKGSFGLRSFSHVVSALCRCSRRTLGCATPTAVLLSGPAKSVGMNPIDQTHQVDLWLDHAFTERWQAKLSGHAGGRPGAGIAARWCDCRIGSTETTLPTRSRWR